jgi:hypothetical protein
MSMFLSGRLRSSGWASRLPSARERRDHVAEAQRVWALRLDALLGVAQLRRGDELHRARDLLRARDARNAPADVLRIAHRS